GIEDDAAPAVIVGEKGRAQLAVKRELVDVPDAVKRRLGPSSAVDVPSRPAAVRIHRDEPETKGKLCSEGDAIAAACSQNLRLSGSLDGAIKKEEVGETGKLGRKKEQRHQNEVEGEQLYGHVVRHVKHEDLGHVRKTNQSAQNRRTWEDQ